MSRYHTRSKARAVRVDFESRHTFFQGGLRFNLHSGYRHGHSTHSADDLNLSATFLRVKLLIDK